LLKKIREAQKTNLVELRYVRVLFMKMTSDRL